MKTYASNLKRIIAISSLALAASTTPIWAQDNSANSSSQPSSSQSSAPHLEDASRTSSAAMDSSMRASQPSATRDTTINEPSGADNNGSSWSWLGLLGLLGLFGLKRRHEAHDETYRTQRA
jgi:MYXO-CTERM domain-containing protein